MTFRYYITVLLFSFLPYIHSAQILNCPQNQIKFEKFIGIKPSSQQKRTLLYSNNNNSPVTLECLTKCADDNNCASFLLYYNSSQCYSFTNTTSTTQNYDYDSKPDTNVAWFRKTCLNLNVPKACEKKAWITEIVAGATLVGQNTKKISTRISRQSCIDYCHNEKTFLCKSAKFSLITTNQDTSNSDPLGFCVLSDTDRHLTPNAFRVSRYEDEYIENQCVNITRSPEYCAYEEYDNTVLAHTDIQFFNTTQQQCENMCDESSTFNCRGYSVLSVRNSKKITCLLHSENSKLIGPQLLLEKQGARYYEKARCLNVTVTCSSNLMSIVYRPEQKFYGRIYTYGYSDTPPCYSDGNNNAPIHLNIPLNTTVCGITEAQTAEPFNRTLKSALLVIQYNALIQTQADRLIKVGCVYGNNNDDTEVTLGTSVNFTNSFPNHGSTVVNSSSVLPVVSFRIVDYNTKETTFDTEIGQELQMIIEITPGDGPYDIWASNLVATSGNNTLQLLDEQGCPTSLNIFSPFTKIQTNTSRLLISTFQAFKFPSTPVVRFSIMVHFCTLSCPPMRCVNDESQLRIKRETNITSIDQLLSVVNATVYKIQERKNSNDTEDIVQEMPLNIVLIVRGVNISPDQLVYSENNRILIAGYDTVNNEVCLDYDLFVGLLVTWVLLQVIIVVCCYLLIRKYKKYFHIAYTRHLDDIHQNFGFGNRDMERRVHWADQ